jgi:hypothetical protein
VRPDSSAGISARLYVTANRDDQAEGFHGDSAEDERGSRGWGWKEHKRGNREEKTGWHDEQSGIFHSLSLSGIGPMYACAPDPEITLGPQCLWFVTEDYRLERLYEFYMIIFVRVGGAEMD